MQPLHHKLPRVHALFEQILKCTFKFVIAGGFPRDIAHGHYPKDMDICIYGLTDDNIGMVDVLLGYARQRFEFIEEHEIKHDKRIYRALRFGITSTYLHFDLIVYKSEYQDESHLMSTMDYNLNAYVFDHVKETPVFVGQNEGTLAEQRVGGCADPERRTYLADKAKSFGWAVPASLTD